MQRIPRRGLLALSVAFVFLGLAAREATAQACADEPRTPISSLPYTISQPGSYYLNGNLTGSSGITIAASGVTLDLMGFTLSGTGAAASGIQTWAPYIGITIRNGAIKGWGLNGINAGSIVSTSRDVTVQDVHVSNNAGEGVSIGHSSRLLHVTSESNGTNGFGIYGAATTVEGCIAKLNGAGGFLSWGGSVTFTDSVANYNAGNGFEISGGTIHNCVASLNAANGFVVSDSTVTGSSAFDNAGYGFDLLQVRISDCVADRNTTGIRINTGAVHGCTLSANRNSGVQALNGVAVVDNNARSNGLGGFGAGLYISGTDNRVEGNNVTGNQLGVYVEAAGNLILRNSASGNPSGNYSISAGNTTGPTVTSANIGTSSNPHANYSY